MVDSEVLSGQLLAGEIDVVHESTKCDHNIVIVNTCGFIDKAKEESVNTILVLTLSSLALSIKPQVFTITILWSHLVLS